MAIKIASRYSYNLYRQTGPGLMKKTLFYLLVLYMAVSLCGCASAFFSSQKEPVEILTIGTADIGGTMYPVGKALAQIINQGDSRITVNLSASNGSFSNAQALENGEIDLGLISGDIAFSAVNGQDAFDQKPLGNLRIVAAVYPSLSNWMAPSAMNIRYVHDLMGKRIGIGPEDSTTALSARIVLNTMGIGSGNSTLENCSLEAGASRVSDGSLDAVHGFTGIPVNSLSGLSSRLPCTVLQYTPEELDSIVKENPFYYKDVIPAGTYKGQEEDVATFGIKCLLCVPASMDEELVYELTSILYNNTEQLKEQHPALSSMSKEGFMYDELPIALHPGAERFYKEMGLLNH